MAYTPGKGTRLKLSISSVFTDIANVVSLTPPSMEMGSTETTHLLSAWREFIANIPDGGEVQFTIEYDPTGSTHQQLFTSFSAGTTESWKVVFNDAGNAEVAFEGFVTGFSWDEVAVDGVVTASITIKLTGAVLITP